MPHSRISALGKQPSEATYSNMLQNGGEWPSEAKYLSVTDLLPFRFRYAAVPSKGGVERRPATILAHAVVRAICIVQHCEQRADEDLMANEDLMA